MIQNMKKNECVVFNMQLSPDYKFTKNQEKLYSFCYEKDLKTLQEGGEVVLKIGKVYRLHKDYKVFIILLLKMFVNFFKLVFGKLNHRIKKKDLLY